MGCFQSKPVTEKRESTANHAQQNSILNNNEKPGEEKLVKGAQLSKESTDTECSVPNDAQDTSSRNQKGIRKLDTRLTVSRKQWFSGSFENLDILSGDRKVKDRLRSLFPTWKPPMKCKLCSRSSNCITEDYINSPMYSDNCKGCAQRRKNADNAKRSSGEQSKTGVACILALAALDLSAPATDAVLRNRKNAWVQLAGHPGVFAPAGPNTIWKKRISKENYETKAYTSLAKDAAFDLVPYFHREVEFNDEYFIEMEDLLQRFSDPNIMDIKMGSRTFLESEVKNQTKRKDLYEKMIKVSPNAPTEEERDEGAITKLRYMQFREQESSSHILGFRIEAVRMASEPPDTNLKQVRTAEQITDLLRKFISGNKGVQKGFLTRLKEIRDKIKQSQFFMNHEIIGSSLLLMYDKSGKSGAWMIDFAKTIPVEVPITHELPWQNGNHEDGYLIGLQNMIKIVNENDLENPPSPGRYIEEKT